MKNVCALSHYSRVRLFATLWTVARQLLCPWDSPGKNTVVSCHAALQEIHPLSPNPPALASRLFTTSITWEAQTTYDALLKMHPGCLQDKAAISQHRKHIPSIMLYIISITLSIHSLTSYVLIILGYWKLTKYSKLFQAVPCSSLKTFISSSTRPFSQLRRKLIISSFVPPGHPDTHTYIYI